MIINKTGDECAFSDTRIPNQNYFECVMHISKIHKSKINIIHPQCQRLPPSQQLTMCLFNIQHNSFALLSLYIVTMSYVPECTNIIRTEILQVSNKIPLKVFYAIKANSNPNIVRLILELGIYGCQTVSLEEIEICLKCEVPPSRIFNSSNFMTAKQLEKVFTYGVNVNLGDMEQIIKHTQFLKEKQISLRINTLIGDGHCDKVITNSPQSKFGIPLKDALNILTFCKQQGILVIGLHQHMGSNFKEVNKLIDNIHLMFDLCNKAKELFPNFKFLNIGGGYGVPSNFDDARFDLADFFSKLQFIHQDFCKRNGFQLQLYTEPGRFLVSESGFLVTEVATVKKCEDTVWVGVNSGMNHLIRPALYDSFHDIKNSILHDSKKQKIDFCGNICQSGDILGRNRQMSMPHQKDLITICNAGAYCYSMSSNYNSKGRPCEVLIQGGKVKLIRKRQTVEDQLRTVVWSDE